MASFTPYTYIQCPCHDSAVQGRTADDASPTVSHELDEDDDDHAFDPRAHRSTFSLYPLEYLLYCDVCHQIRCPRCVSEELVTIYCPNCLFEVGSSSLKTEGNRSTNPRAFFAQLQKLRYGEDQSKHVVSGDTSPTKPDSIPDTNKARFAALKSFYGSQTINANPSAGLSGLGDYGLSSPGALTRIMSIYSGNNMNGLKQKNKHAIMREADSTNEGFRLVDLDESSAISQLRRDGWDGTATSAQGKTQVEEGAQFADQLWPIPYLLRTKRSKRCPVCRHIISKPEPKVSNTRWRIRLAANNNAIPTISIKPLNLLPGSGSGSGLLNPLRPAQFLLTFKNPLFDDVKVTLATPATTPGRFASRVTVLCPEFSIDANPDNDMYLDDVLKDGEKERQRQRGDEGIHQAEAGKIWDRGRNWVSIVVEVVPASLRIEPPPALLRKEGDPEQDLSPLREDEDVLEIPMFVRLEWESEASHDQVGAATTRDKDAKEKRELAYWCAIGIGRISQE
ncbi:hypothetical protein E0Z10_g6476 [Xylaria hypoxylon]|uniref:Dynactin subunit 4 n=1 Tax=Xylaria hypoxylon TaxID=37992 RepID=A0A4Z0YSB7_9PEZI|nr:hypothetical protein E0Z10_g6476 [Xylaria hypoxylon]